MTRRTVVSHRRELPKPQPTRVDQGDLGMLAQSFERGLRAARLSASTIRIYTVSVSQFADFLASRGMPLVVANITREHVEEWLISILEHGAAGTADTRFRGLKAFFKWALEEGEISRDPMLRVKRPKPVEVPPPMLTDDEITRLLATCTGSGFEARRDTAILRLFIDTGLRRSELAYLTLDDVDLNASMVRVMGKGSRGRIVPFGRKTSQALDRYMRARARHRFAREQSVWLGRQGPMGDGAVDLMVRRRASQAGLDAAHSHLFRHGFAHSMKSSGMSTEDLMAIGGWRSYEMVARYGASAAAERARDAYQRMPSPGDRF